MRPRIHCVAALCVLGFCATAWAADTDPVRELTEEQDRVRARMFALEQRVLEVADLIEAERPEVARRLRVALGESRQRFIVARMATIRSLLSQEDYGAAAERQRAVLRDLAAFTALLDPVRAAGELEMLREAAARMRALAERQAEAAEGTRQALTGVALPGDPAAEQAAIRLDARSLLDELQAAQGAGRLAAALQRMAAAEAALTAARQGDALADQLAALDELAGALAEVEDAIRRLEESSVESMRVQLREMLEGMLGEQTTITRDTTALREAYEGTGEPDRALRIAASELGQRQAGLLPLVQDAADLVAEAGGSPAVSAGLAGVREDVSTCADRLSEGIADETVAALQKEVEAVLGSLLAAVTGEMLGPSEEEPAQPGEKERAEAGRLIGARAELRVLGQMQVRLLARTARAEDSRTPDAELSPAAAEEARRIGGGQARITEALGRIQMLFAQAGMP